MYDDIFEVKQEGKTMKVVVNTDKIADDKQEKFSEIIDQALASDIDELLIDFSMVSLLNSSAIGKLLFATNIMSKKGKKLVITKISSNLYKKLDLLALTDILNIQEIL